MEVNPVCIPSMVGEPVITLRPSSQSHQYLQTKDPHQRPGHSVPTLEYVKIGFIYNILCIWVARVLLHCLLQLACRDFSEFERFSQKIELFNIK